MFNAEELRKTNNKYESTKMFNAEYCRVKQR